MIFTFYSYKGGVGRSMAMAAVAHLLAQRGLRVLAVDFDLEAPGLERYFFDGDRCPAIRAEAGLVDLLLDYRRALSDEAEFARATFKDLDRYYIEAVVHTETPGGRVDLMTSGRREPAEALRNYALTVRTFDWQDFFYNWKGDRFFEWLREQWLRPDGGYDVVLVDSRTGVTEMGGVCAYQLADVAVLLCAPNYQNLEGTRDVARDFTSPAVLGLRHGRVLEILAVPARLEASHPRRDDFLVAFERELATDGLPLALASLGLGYRDLVLPYLPEYAIEERLVDEVQGQPSHPPSASLTHAFERLADALTLLAPPNTALGRQRDAALIRIKGGATATPARLEADTSRISAGFDVFIDYGADDVDTARHLAEQLEAAGLRVHFDARAQGTNSEWQGEIETALDYSAHLLVCFGRAAGSRWRERLLRRARNTASINIIPVLLPGAKPDALQSFGLESTLAVDLRDTNTQAGEVHLLMRLSQRTRSYASPGSDPAHTPYPGARPYLEDEARYFHGREGEIEAILDALRKHAVVVLEGPAKVGKTSLVQAGLLPRLRALAAGEGEWQAGPITRVSPDADQAEWPQCSVSAGAGSRPMLIVDHIDSESGGQDLAARLERITGWVEHAGPDAGVLLLWRGTLPDQLHAAALARWRKAGLAHIHLAPLTGPALRRAIEQPAREAGHLLDSGLLERLVESAGDAHNAIFQIQLALAALWPTRRRGWLTNKSLDALGHLGGVFASHVETTLAALDAEQRAGAQVLFHRLCVLDPALKMIPAAQTWHPLESIPALERLGARRLRDTLGEHGLIDLWRDRAQAASSPAAALATPNSGEVRVALVRPDPACYLSGDRIQAADFLIWRSQFETVMQHWLASGLHDDALLRGNAQAEAMHWLSERHDEMTSEERALITSSEAAIKAQERAEHEREALQRDNEAAREAAEQRARLEQSANVQLRRRAHLLLIAMGIVLMMATWATRMYFNAEEHRNQAVSAERRTNALRLAFEGELMVLGSRPGNDLRAMLQVMAAHRTDPGSAIEGPALAMLLTRRDLVKIWSTHSSTTAVAFSPEGMHIATGSSDNTIRFWNADTGVPIGTPLGTPLAHKDLDETEAEVTSVAFSPDGRRIVSGNADNTLRLWNAATGEPIGTPFSGHKGPVWSVAFSPDGRRIASGSRDDTLRLWNADTGETIGTPFVGHTDTVLSVAFSPDGRRIVSGSEDKTLRLWNADTGETIGVPLTGHTDWVRSVAFSPDGRRIVSGSDDNTLRRWNTDTGAALGTPCIGHTNTVTSVAFSPDGVHIVSGSEDKTVRLWNADTGEPIGRPLSGHTDGVRSVAFSPDGRRIISGSWDNTLRLWNADPGETIGKPLAEHEEGFLSVAFSADGRRIVTGSWDRTVRLWNAETGEAIGAPLTGHQGWVSSVVFSPDGRRIVSGSRDNTLRLWNAETREPIGSPLIGHTDTVMSVAFSPDGRRIVSASSDNTLRLWSAETGKAIGTPLAGYQGWVTSVAFSPDGRLIVSGSDDATLRRWNADTGEVIGTPLTGHTDRVLSVAFSPDGRRIVSGSRDNTLRLWNADTGEAIGPPLTGHTGGVRSVTFSPEGRRIVIVSSSDDNTLRLWNADTGETIGTPLTGHTDTVRSVAFSPDGRQIVSASDDNSLRLWPAPDAWPDLICSRLTRNMSRREWREWVSADTPYVCQCPGLPIAPDDIQSDKVPEPCPGPT